MMICLVYTTFRKFECDKSQTKVPLLWNDVALCAFVKVKKGNVFLFCYSRVSYVMFLDKTSSTDKQLRPRRDNLERILV